MQAISFPKGSPNEDINISLHVRILYALCSAFLNAEEDIVPGMGQHLKPSLAWRTMSRHTPIFSQWASCCTSSPELLFRKTWVFGAMVLWEKGLYLCWVWACWMVRMHLQGKLAAMQFDPISLLCCGCPACLCLWYLILSNLPWPNFRPMYLKQKAWSRSDRQWRMNAGF